MKSNTTLVTVELPLTVWQGLNKQGTGNNRMAAWQRARDREDVRLLVLQESMEGVGATALSRKYNVSRRTVMRWRKEHLQRVHSDTNLENL